MNQERKSSILIGTDVAIDFLRGKQYAKSLLEQLWEEDRAHISILSVYELLAGMRDEEEKATTDFVMACKIQNVDLSVAYKAGEFYRKYRKRGKTLTSIDCLIMATAACRNLKIATRNLKHYPEGNLLEVIRLKNPNSPKKKQT